jgi:magnesium chelatase subunit D
MKPVPASASSGPSANSERSLAEQSPWRGGPGLADDASAASIAIGDAWRAAACLAVDPAGTGAVLRADPGEASGTWLEAVRTALPATTPLRRVPAHIDDERLLGGTDLAATLQQGRPVRARGVLEEIDGGVIVLPIAERVSAQLAGRIAGALDRHAISVVRDGRVSEVPTHFGVVAIDSGRGDEERCAAALRDRLAMHVDLHGLSLEGDADLLPAREAIQAARARLPGVTLGDDALRALCASAAACGIDSLRAPVLALRVARTSAALDGRSAADEDDVAFAARVVLAPRSTVWPSDPTATEPPAPTPEPEPDAARPESQAGDRPDSGAMQDRVLAATRAAIPADLLAQLAAEPGARHRAASIGRAGASVVAKRRGRPAGVRAGKPRNGSRLNIVATLRAAAPWQRVRRAAASISGPRVLVRVSDFHVTWYRQRTQTVTVFVLDASGSSALHRLAEAKGAVELLLAECYVRRDQVAVLAFRGRAAQLVLAPTRSLLRAKRSLAGLPGGGGTPLAAGLDAAAALAAQVTRHGQTPSLVLLTDGAANIARDGSGGRARAAEDALGGARAVAHAGWRALVIDTAPRPSAQARELAQAMRARYLPLPDADARTLAAAVQHAA